MFGFGLIFSEGIAFLVFGALFLLVLLVVPCEADREHGHSSIKGLRAVGAVGGCHPYFRNGSSVTVFRIAFKANFFAIDEIAHVLLGVQAEWLAFLWGIDSGQPDLVLRLGVVKDSDCVAVSDANNPAGDVGTAGKD